MKKQAGPPSTYLEDLAAVQKFKDSPEEVVAIGFFSSQTSATILESFIESGNNVRLDVRLGHTTDKKIAEQLKFSVNSIIVFHPKKLVSKYEKGYSEIPNIEYETSEDLGRTLTQAAKPLVGQVTLKNFNSLYAHRPLLVAYYDVKWDHENIKGKVLKVYGVRICIFYCKHSIKYALKVCGVKLVNVVSIFYGNCVIVSNG